MFETTFRTEARWASIVRDGLDQCHVEASEEAIVMRGVAIGTFDERDFAVTYRIECEPDWTIRSFEAFDVDGNECALNRDGERWLRRDGTEDRRLAGARIIDLSGTPLTNTLAVRTMADHAEGASTRHDVVYVPFDTLDPMIDGQRYTCRIPYERYHYEAVDGTFETTLRVDRFGLITEYPGLFQRLG